jgi:carbonic anhydrase
VRPSVEGLLTAEPPLSPDAIYREAVRANIRASVRNLRKGSEILEQLVQDGQLVIVGAEYSLETGIVEFFDGVPAGA